MLIECKIQVYCDGVYNRLNTATFTLALALASGFDPLDQSAEHWFLKLKGLGFEPT